LFVGNTTLLPGDRRLLLRGAFGSSGLHCLPTAHPHAAGQGEEHRGGAREAHFVPAHGLLELVKAAGRTGHNGLVTQVAPDVSAQAVGRFVAAVAVLFQTLHHDPIEVSGE
jgi:hypothetical protein